jgi:hypothetical protein
MSDYVDKERVAGERRIEALFSKKTEFLCPGYTQKSMSLCVRQYIQNYKVETASSYFSLSHFIQIAATQDHNAKIFDSVSAQLVSFESLFVLQENLRKENMVCSKLKPTSPQNLLEIKQICASEEKLFSQYQEKNKKYIQKKLSEMLPLLSDADGSTLSVWKKNKVKDLSAKTENEFNKNFFEQRDFKLQADDILAQHQTTIAVSCKNLTNENKKRFNKNKSCEKKFSEILWGCIPRGEPREPANVKEKEIIKMIQEPLPCYYQSVQDYLAKTSRIK